ncbi:hypothetical protein SKAU_G00299000 [Synaphobranchus kaupii]|uniref:Uncharacterized protein n=1 Tax=Synaphobranchus kaupii TaxID=118154 RepID=A0A9Q1EVF1_SYNKA|nr:hypothetical protein SKAU_G00299000 [Synaphobranchus kaupii]
MVVKSESAAPAHICPASPAHQCKLMACLIRLIQMFERRSDEEHGQTGAVTKMPTEKKTLKNNLLLGGHILFTLTKKVFSEGTEFEDRRRDEGCGPAVRRWHREGPADASW